MQDAPPPCQVKLDDFFELRRTLDAACNEVKNQKERLRHASECLYEESRNLGRPVFIARDSMPPETSSSRNDSLRRLAPREVEVLRLIAEGLSTKEIAGRLRISFKTAVCYRTRLLEKLQMHETPSLVRLAIRAGLVST